MILNKKIAAMAGFAMIAAAVYADTLTVTNTNYSGEGSLAAVIEEANGNGVASNIVFDIPGGGTILLDNTLPEINSPVFIDGSNESGQVILEGAAPTGPGQPVSGLVFERLAMHSTVRNLNTVGFLNAVWIKTSKVNIINCTFTNAFARAVRIEPTEIHSNPMMNLASSVMYCTFENNDALSIEVIKEGGTTISNNTINSGAVVVDSSENVTIRDNVFDSNGSSSDASLLLRNSRTSYISRNTFKNNSSDALVLVDNDDADLWNNIDYNVFENNTGWDLALYGTDNTNVFNNTVNGDAFAFEAGIYLESVNKTKIQRNTLKGARISALNSKFVQIGGMGADKNSITEDPQGVSAYGAVILTGSDSCDIIGNDINNNSSNGVVISNSSANELFYNTISNNGRTGVKVISGNSNTIRYNTIFGHHADALGGINSISLFNGANNDKAAPSISSVISDGVSNVVVSGTGNPGDIINVLESSKPLSPLSYDAIKDLGVTGVSSDSTWSVTIPASEVSLAELYVTANATDIAGNSSELAHVAAVVLTDGIAGPSEVTRGLSFNFSVVALEVTYYQWWANGDVTITGNGSNNTEMIFHNQPGSVVKLSVGYSDPENGWVVKELDVTVK